MCWNELCGFNLLLGTWIILNCVCLALFFLHCDLFSCSVYSAKGKKIGVSLSLYWYATLRRDHPGYCTAEVGNPGGTYELPCRLWTQVGATFTENELHRHSQVSALIHSGWLKKCGSTEGRMDRPATMKTEETGKCCWCCNIWSWMCTDGRTEISSYSQFLSRILLFKHGTLRAHVNSI
jgi:hypothetical protein